MSSSSSSSTCSQDTPPSTPKPLSSPSPNNATQVPLTPSPPPPPTPQQQQQQQEQQQQIIVPPLLLDIRYPFASVVDPQAMDHQLHTHHAHCTHQLEQACQRVGQVLQHLMQTLTWFHMHQMESFSEQLGKEMTMVQQKQVEQEMTRQKLIEFLQSIELAFQSLVQFNSLKDT